MSDLVFIPDPPAPPIVEPDYATWTVAGQLSNVRVRADRTGEAINVLGIRMHRDDALELAQALENAVRWLDRADALHHVVGVRVR